MVSGSSTCVSCVQPENAYLLIFVMSAFTVTLCNAVLPEKVYSSTAAGESQTTPVMPAPAKAYAPT